MYVIRVIRLDEPFKDVWVSTEHAFEETFDVQYAKVFKTLKGAHKAAQKRSDWHRRILKVEPKPEL